MSNQAHPPNDPAREGGCDRCGRDDPGQVGTFPDPAGDGLGSGASVWWCVRCWAERAAEVTPLTEDEATVAGAMEYLGYSLADAGHLVGRPAGSAGELRRRAFDKLSGAADPDEMEPMTPMTWVGDVTR